MRSARSVASGHTLNSPAGYQRLDSTSKTLKLSNDLGRVFSKFRPIIFSIVVDKVALLKQARSDSPLGIAYALLHERIALSIEKLFGNESAVIIADQQTQHEHYFRSGGMSAARDALARNLREKPNLTFTTTRCMLDGIAPEQRSFLWPEIKHAMAIHWTSGSIERSGFAIYPPTLHYPAL